MNKVIAAATIIFVAVGLCSIWNTWKRAAYSLPPLCVDIDCGEVGSGVADELRLRVLVDGAERDYIPFDNYRHGGLSVRNGRVRLYNSFGANRWDKMEFRLMWLAPIGNADSPVITLLATGTDGRCLRKDIRMDDVGTNVVTTEHPRIDVDGDGGPVRLPWLGLVRFEELDHKLAGAKVNGGIVPASCSAP